MAYTDSNFYYISDDLSYTIRGEIVLEDLVDGTVLQHAVNTSFLRFPYFSVRLVLMDGGYTTVPNDLPHNVIHSAEQIVLGSEDVNFHLAVISYSDNRIFFNISHCITDGIGRLPLTRSVLYYYISEKYGVNPDPQGIYLAGSSLFEDETTEPASYEDVKDAEPKYYCRVGQAYRLSESGQIRDHERTEYRFRVDEESFTGLCKAAGASQCNMAAALLARCAWNIDRNIDKNIVVNLCMDMRAGLRNKHSYTRLISCIPAVFTPEMKDMSRQEISSITRKAIFQQSRRENVQYLYKLAATMQKKLTKVRSIDMRKKLMQACIHGPEGFLSSTYLLSFMGKSAPNAVTPYIKESYTAVDSIPKDGLMLEITYADGHYCFSFLQDFSTDIYVKEFIRLLRESGTEVSDYRKLPLLSPLILLPEQQTENRIIDNNKNCCNF